VPLPLPSLDDRRWVDLVEEGQALIPFYSPEWTDHNVHDPGITLMELFAWVTEMDLYQLNQIPEEHKRKFLALAGVVPTPPQPSRAVLSLRLRSGKAIELPKGTQFEKPDPLAGPIRFRTVESLAVIPGHLKALQFEDQQRFTDLTKRWQNRESIQLFGKDPRPGATLYLGYTEPLPTDQWTSLFVLLSGLSLAASEEERDRLKEEEGIRANACRPPDTVLTCMDTIEPQSSPEPEKGQLRHHSVQLAWEYLDSQRRWHVLESATGMVIDETRAFTLNGRVLVKPDRLMGKEQRGHVQEKLYYLRCRFTAGAYDLPPDLQTIVFNGVEVEQAVPPKKLTKHNVAGKELWIKRLGSGDGTPFQQLSLAEKPDDDKFPPESTVVESSLKVFTVEGGVWKEWLVRPNLDASTRADLHCLLDSAKGLVTFGDGEKGRVVPEGVEIYASYLLTRAELGNLPARSITELSDPSHNEGLSALNYSDAKARLGEIHNPFPAEGGAKAESVSEAAARAVLKRERTERAVTLDDYERLAKQTPGARLARVSARANLHPGFPCFDALGMVTVIIVPFLPCKRPMPSAALRRHVTAYLNRRRVIGTRVEVVGPTYVSVAVKARVQSAPGTNRVQLRRRLVSALDKFFDPLEGGPDGDGWPFGRDVYRGEVLQMLDEESGVDHVLSLEFLDGTGTSRCGNLCLGPLGLVAAGEHQIEVI
jgi:predicted phage baseplate assembly protein